MSDLGGLGVLEAGEHAAENLDCPREGNGTVVADPGAQGRPGNKGPRVVNEGTRPPRPAGRHEMRVLQLLGQQQHGALELEIVDAQRQSGRQNLDQELRAVVGLACHKQPVFSYRPDFALDPIQGAEGFR